MAFKKLKQMKVKRVLEERSYGLLHRITESTMKTMHVVDETVTKTFNKTKASEKAEKHRAKERSIRAKHEAEEEALGVKYEEAEVKQSKKKTPPLSPAGARFSYKRTQQYFRNHSTSTSEPRA